MVKQVELKLDDTITIKRGEVVAVIELIGELGTGAIPFKRVAELIAALQHTAKSPVAK